MSPLLLYGGGSLSSQHSTTHIRNSGSRGTPVLQRHKFTDCLFWNRRMNFLSQSCRSVNSRCNLRYHDITIGDHFMQVAISIDQFIREMAANFQFCPMMVFIWMKLEISLFDHRRSFLLCREKLRDHQTRNVSRILLVAART